MHKFVDRCLSCFSSFAFSFLSFHLFIHTFHTPDVGTIIFLTSFPFQNSKNKHFSFLFLSLNVSRILERERRVLEFSMRTSSAGRCTTSKTKSDFLENSETSSPTAGTHVYGAMLPVFLNDLRSNHHKELVEITLELENDAVVLRNIASVSSAPNASSSSTHISGDGDNFTGVGVGAGVELSVARSLSITSRIKKKFPWLRSMSLRSLTSSSESVTAMEEDPMTARNVRRMRAELDRTRSSAQRGLKGLRFISKSGEACEELWKKVEKRFGFLAKDGLLDRENFGECIGTLYFVLMLRNI